MTSNVHWWGPGASSINWCLYIHISCYHPMPVLLSAVLYSGVIVLLTQTKYLLLLSVGYETYVTRHYTTKLHQSKQQLKPSL